MDVNLRCYRKRGLRVPPGCAFGESPQIVDSAGTGNRQVACECVVCRAPSTPPEWPPTMALLSALIFLCLGVSKPAVGTL